MAYLHRLIICGIILLSSWLPTSSYAVDYTPWSGSTPLGTLTNPVHTALCEAMVGAYTAASSTLNYRFNHISFTDALSGSCTVDAQNKSPGGSVGWYAGGWWGISRTVLACPYGSDGAGGCLPCPAGQKSYSTVMDVGSIQGCAPVPPCSASSGKVLGSVSKKYTGSFAPTSYECVGGCVSKTKFDFRAKYTDSLGVTQDEQVGDTIGTGASCGTVTADGTTALKPAPLNSATNPNSAKDAACPSGQVPRLVNGVSVCGAPGAGSETSSTSTTTSTAPDGTIIKQEKTTTCVGTECTTTTKTTTTPPGQPPTDTTKTDTDNKANLCKDNPGLSICKTSTFAGACGAPPTCDGDAVMCAVAAATFATNCVLKDPGAPTPLYDEAKDKTGDQTEALPGNLSVSIGAGSFDQTELLGAAAGMTDRTVVVARHSIIVPFSSVNIWLVRLGIVLQAVTFLLCARIVVRG